MKLREAIRTIVREVIGEDLRQVVREVLMEELLDTNEAPAQEPTPRSDARSQAAKKAAATRAANKATGALPRHAQAKVKELGLAIGQQWKGRSYLKKVAGRVIEIASIDATGVRPKIVNPVSGRPQAKHLTFDYLRKCYTKVEPAV